MSTREHLREVVLRPREAARILNKDAGTESGVARSGNSRPLARVAYCVFGGGEIGDRVENQRDS